jgi:cytochrome P450
VPRVRPVRKAATAATDHPPQNAWRVKTDDHIPDGGPMLQSGDTVIWSDFEMGRFPEVWGPDAAEFKPSRWNPGWRTQKGESVKGALLQWGSKAVSR